MSSVCSVCNELTENRLKNNICKCGLIVCDDCYDNTLDITKNKPCSFAEKCASGVVEVCAGCGDWILGQFHKWLKTYDCTYCGSFSCEECFGEDFQPNTGCKSQRGCIACGACEMWDKHHNLHQKNLGNEDKDQSCDNCLDQRVTRKQLMEARIIARRQKNEKRCDNHPTKKKD